jgi:parvulin-like peptidyl-prolyl isomerase
MLTYLRSGNKRTKAIFWVLTVLTVMSFVGGFIFLAGVGRDPVSRARQTGSVGSINGQPVTTEQWRVALDEARLGYRQRYGVDPQDRDVKQVEQTAWRTLVNERMFAQQAKQAGLGVTDNEVLVGMRTNPPTVIATSPSFQTNGQFDMSKYQQALANPANNWAPFEDMLRQQIPVRKLQEHLMSSLKLTQPELKQAFRDRYDRVAATLVTVPAADSGHSGGSEAELAKVYDLYKTRMAAGARTQLEVLTIPKRYGADEIKAALDMGRSLYARAQQGEDFAQLAKDYSEGPNAERGGLIDRWLSPAELGGMVGEAIKVKKPGEVIEPVQEGGRVLVLKIMDPAKDTSSTKTPPPSPDAVKLSQIVIKVRPAPEELRQQAKDAKAIADDAQKVGLSKAATNKGLSTTKTGYYDQNNGPPQLFATPEAADWGLYAKKGAVSPVYEGQDEFVIVSVAMQHAAGPPSRDEMGEQLKMIADAEHRVDLARPRADGIAAAVKSGKTLEDAARAAGLPATAIASLTTNLQQPDPRLSGAPELLGMLFAAPRGKVLGPVRSSQGWLFARVDGMTAAPDTMFNDQLRGQLTNEIMSRRQRSFFDGLIEKLRTNAQVADLRGQGGSN